MRVRGRGRGRGRATSTLTPTLTPTPYSNPIPNQVSILYANQTPEDILCQEELDMVAKDPRVKVALPKSLSS